MCFIVVLGAHLKERSMFDVGAAVECLVGTVGVVMVTLGTQDVSTGPVVETE